MRTSTIWGIVCLAVGVIGVFVLALLWGLGVWGPGTAAVSSAGAGAGGYVDRHFIEEMIPHHEDAVEMAELALTRAEHQELKHLAEDIQSAQSAEIEQMRGWYRSWYGAELPTDADEDVGGGRRRGGMMGGSMMGDTTDMDALRAAEEFDKEFIEQMIPHHQMGVMMARMVLNQSEQEEIRELARSIIQTQTEEIELMRDWYRQWYE